MLLNSSSLGYYFTPELGYFRSHCCQLSSASGCIDLTRSGSHHHCGSRARGARFQDQALGFEAEPHTSSCFLAPRPTAPASGGRTPNDCFFAAAPRAGGQSQIFRLWSQNDLQFRHQSP